MDARGPLEHGSGVVSATPIMSSSISDQVEAASIPPSPEKLEDTGLSADAVRDLLLKVLYVQGSRSGQYLADFLRLPFPLVDEELLTLQQRRFIEVRGTTAPHRGSYLFDLGEEGRNRAREALNASQYVGPMPVPLSQYQHWIHAQSIKLA